MKRSLLALAALAALIPFKIGASQATFVAASANPGATFSTAADFNTVAVSIGDPGALLRGTVALSATAASDRGLVSVTFQSSPAGAGAWTNLCVDNAAPFSCDFDTVAVADGVRDIRAVALDTAGFTRESVVPARRIDNTAPAVSLKDPGSPLSGVRSLSTTASDGGSGLASVELQYRLGSGAWTTICAGLTCNWATASLADGMYDLRSLAVDAAGNVGTSVVSNRQVDNTAPAVTVAALPAAVRGTVAMAATVNDANGAGVTSVRYQVRPASTGVWTDFCTAVAAPFTCSAATGAFPDGVIDVRAIAVDGASLATTSATVASRIDSTAPSSASLTAPAAVLAGTVALNATAVDAGSGIATIAFQRSPAGASTWSTICTSASTSCAWDTTGVTDGLYDLRIVATDVAGNARTSAAVAGRRVDNHGPTVTVADPGSPLRGTVTFSAAATDPAGVASVKIQGAPAGSSTWVDICTSTSCSIDTRGVADGLYDLRAIATDTLGRSTTSATVAGRRIDNTAPRGTDVQAVNGSGTRYQIDAGDVVTFTFSEDMAPGSILAGWNGSPINVAVRVNNSSNADTITIFNQANTTQLNLSTLQLRSNHVSTSARFAGTAVLDGERVVITLGALAAGSTRASTSAQMRWAPAATATDLAGNGASTATVYESGPADADF